MGAPPPLLVCPATTFVTDPQLGDTVALGYSRPTLHGPTTGPNRYTLHVPTETTRLSLGKDSPHWVTDVGITGYTNSHIDFETKKNDKTVVSLGGPTTKAAIKGHGDSAPVATHGYSMVTDVNAWHDAKLQHYLLSRAGDISLRTRGGDKRAVIQSDTGSVELNAGKQVNVSGGGVSIGAAGELEVEDVGYAGSWAGLRPHSTSAAGSRIGAAVFAAMSAIQDVIFNVPRHKYEPGNFAKAEEEWGDKNKRRINSALFLLAAKKVYSAAAAPVAPPKSVKLDAEKHLAALAGGEISFFGLMGASLGSVIWTTVSAGLSASLKAVAFGGVAGGFVSAKGLRKAEMGSDWGKIFVGTKKEIHAAGEKKFTVAAKKEAHVASPEDEGQLLLGGASALFMGTPKGQQWGLRLDDKGVALGQATNADKMEAKVKAKPAIRIDDDKIELKGGVKPTITIDSGNVRFTAPQIRFEATSGSFTVNGAGMILLK